MAVILEKNGNGGYKGLFGRRDRYDIVVAFLEAAKGGKNLTRIMYKTRLPYNYVVAYTKFLLRMGFLREIPNGNNGHEKNNSHCFYEPTERGYMLSNKIGNMDALMS